MEVMGDFVHGAVFWFCERACCWGEGVFFEEEADFVAGGEEVGVADVGGVFAVGEFGHGMVV